MPTIGTGEAGPGQLSPRLHHTNSYYYYYHHLYYFVIIIIIIVILRGSLPVKTKGLCMNNLRI